MTSDPRLHPTWKLKTIITNQHKHRRLAPRHINKCHATANQHEPTLKLASANPFPRHILGPSANDKTCLYPCISFARLPANGAPPSQRSGSNCLAVGPQNASARLMQLTGILICVPFGTGTVSTVWPKLLITGVERGITSSCAVCVRKRKRSLSVERFGGKKGVPLDGSLRGRGGDAIIRS